MEFAFETQFVGSGRNHGTKIIRPKRLFNNIKSFEEIVAEELILAAKGEQASAAVKKKQEIERIALSAR